MPISPSARKISYIYLALLPFLVMVVAFISGHSPYRIYIPLGLVHSCIMLSAIAVLASPALATKDEEKKKQWLILALFLVLPWVFIVIFAGMGPPPTNPIPFSLSI